MNPMPPTSPIRPAWRRRSRPLQRALSAAAAALTLAACSTSLTPRSDGTTTGSLAGGAGAPTASAGPEGAAAVRRQAQVKVALLLPLTGSGPSEPVAAAMRLAAEQAVFDHGASGVQLLVKDDRGTPEGAKAAAEQALAEGAELILGPLFSASVAAAAAPARARGVPILAFSSDRAVAGNGVWLVSFQPDREVRRIVEHAVETGAKRFAALVPADAYGRLVEATLRETVRLSGGDVLFLERYDPRGRGLLQAAQALAGKLAATADSGAAVDALFLPVAPEQLPTLASLVPQMGVDPTRTRLFGAGGWEEVDFTNLPALAGARYAGPEPAGWRHFAARFGRAHGVAPPRIAALAHDAVAIAATLAGGQPGQRFGAAELTRASGFAGIEGGVRLAGDGTAERALAVLEAHRDGPRVVSPASGGIPAGSASQALLAPVLPQNRPAPVAAVQATRTR
jgi:branched-chain amino acid transport system substrate-binding protein